MRSFFLPARLLASSRCLSVCLSVGGAWPALLGSLLPARPTPPEPAPQLPPALLTLLAPARSWRSATPTCQRLAEHAPRLLGSRHTAGGARLPSRPAAYPCPRRCRAVISRPPQSAAADSHSPPRLSRPRPCRGTSPTTHLFAMLSPWRSLLSPTAPPATEIRAPLRPPNRYLRSPLRSPPPRSVARAAPTLSATATAVSSPSSPKKKVRSPFATPLHGDGSARRLTFRVFV